MGIHISDQEAEALIEAEALDRSSWSLRRLVYDHGAAASLAGCFVFWLIVGIVLYEVM